MKHFLAESSGPYIGVSLYFQNVTGLERSWVEVSLGRNVGMGQSLGVFRRAESLYPPPLPGRLLSVRHVIAYRT